MYLIYLMYPIYLMYHMYLIYLMDIMFLMYLMYFMYLMYPMSSAGQLEECVVYLQLTSVGCTCPPSQSHHTGHSCSAQGTSNIQGL